MLRTLITTAFAAAAAFGLAVTTASAGTPPLQKRTACMAGKFQSPSQKVMPQKPPIQKIKPIWVGKPVPYPMPHPKPFPHPHGPNFVVVAPVSAAATVATIAAVQAAPAVHGPVACLTKEYIPTGAVLFRDICTSEWAMNPPAALPQTSNLLDPLDGQ